MLKKYSFHFITHCVKYTHSIIYRLHIIHFFDIYRYIYYYFVKYPKIFYAGIPKLFIRKKRCLFTFPNLHGSQFHVLMLGDY